MTNTEKILAVIVAKPGLTDRQLQERTGIRPHQQVNQICRRLDVEGRIRRVVDPTGRIVNVPADRPPSPVGHAHDPPSHPSSPEKHRSSATILRNPRETMLIVPCSARKRPGGARGGGPSILDALPSGLARELRTARQHVAARAALDESSLLPAWERYAGTFYEVGRSAINAAVVSGQPMVVISGGYGVLLPDELIGMYDRRFVLSDWPQGLLERCLIAIVDGGGLRSVVAFCARTTTYAQLMRQVRWRSHGIAAAVAVPVLGGRGGAQVLVPRAAGESIAPFLRNELSAEWRSSDGVAVEMERLS